MALSLYTASGGIIELLAVRTRFSGDQLVLHVDQTANINNGEGDASVAINEDEIKELISLLNNYLTEKNNGVPHVILAEPILDPAVKITVDFVEYMKNQAEKENPDS